MRVERVRRGAASRVWRGAPSRPRRRGAGRLRLSALLCAVAVAHAVSPAGASAQHCPPGHPGLGEVACPLDAPRWSGELAAFGANALLGGVTAGVSRKLAGGSFQDGFTRGVLGGGIIYAGKRVAVERFAGAGLVGRELAAVGVSVVDNAAAGRGTLERLVLPVWVGRVYLAPGSRHATFRLDALATFWTAYGALEDELTLDARATLSAGTPVFRTHNRVMRVGGDSLHAGGVTSAGVIFLSDVPAWGVAWDRRAFAHERVHTLQMDQIFMQWTLPLERRLLDALPGGVAGRWLDLNLSTEVLRALSGAIPTHRERPWELEAFFLAR